MKKLFIVLFAMFFINSHAYANPNTVCSFISPDGNGATGSVFVSSGGSQYLRANLWYNANSRSDGISGSVEITVNGKTETFDVTDSRCNDNGAITLQWKIRGQPYIQGYITGVITPQNKVITNVAGYSGFPNAGTPLTNNFVFSNYLGNPNKKPNPPH